MPQSTAQAMPINIPQYQHANLKQSTQRTSKAQVHHTANPRELCSSQFCSFQFCPSRSRDTNMTLIIFQYSQLNMQFKDGANTHKTTRPPRRHKHKGGPWRYERHTPTTTAASLQGAETERPPERGNAQGRRLRSLRGPPRSCCTECTRTDSATRAPHRT